MNNIFENAHFGKLYKTRDGHDAVYLFPYDAIIKTTHNLVVNAHYDDTHLCEIVTGDDGRVGSMESPFDIVSEWAIDKEELDKLAIESINKMALENEVELSATNLWKAGYNKATEDK